MTDSRYPRTREDLTPGEWRQRVCDDAVRRRILRLESSGDQRPHCVYIHRDRAGHVRYVGRGLRSRPWCPRQRSARHARLLAEGDLRVEIAHDGLTAREAVRIERAMIEEHAPECSWLWLNRLPGTSLENPAHVS